FCLSRGLGAVFKRHILNDHSMPYDSEALAEELHNLPALPDCFVAANDAIAINLLKALKSLKISVPKDVKVIGFDNVAEAKSCTPPLTSVNVNKSMLGKRIIGLLMDRIANPMQANQIIHISSKLVIRSST
ncbi:MAG: substrate-binding domain-containing protein, partial [Acetatifactor sp.]|nr:substrate-binding domain-containing protein [Acetatifactor sp.]